MAKVGERYYFIAHAYHHYIGEVVEVLGKNHFVLRNVVKVHSCGRSWTEFFRDGLKNDTKFDVMPDGKELIGVFDITPWPHEIPRTNETSR